MRYTSVIDQCVEKIFQNNHHIAEWVLQINGMSGKKYRKLINAIVNKIDNPKYLEIGAWKGSTLCAAISGNRVSATVIDNWSQFDGPKDVFQQNLDRVKDQNFITVIESDFRQVDWNTVGKHNIYMFDGPHEKQDHIDSLTLVAPALMNEFILIIDDWNNKDVQSGTLSALESLSWPFSYIEILTSLDGSYPSSTFENSDWHNGYFIASVAKS